MTLIQVLQSKDSLGVTALENTVNAQRPLGAVMLGSLLDYPISAGSPTGEIQYVQLPFQGGVEFDRIQFFVDQNGSAVRNVRVGLYDQTDPLDRAGLPNNRVAQSNITDTDVSDGTFVDALFTDAATGGSGSPVVYTIPTEGFYWIAFMADNPTAKYAVSDMYRAEFLAVRRESGTGSTLPAAASGLTNPSSSLVYTAALEVLT